MLESALARPDGPIIVVWMNTRGLLGLRKQPVAILECEFEQTHGFPQSLRALLLSGTPKLHCLQSFLQGLTTLCRMSEGMNFR